MEQMPKITLMCVMLGHARGHAKAPVNTSTLISGQEKGHTGTKL